MVVDDGKISRDEFISFWRKATGMGQRGSEIFFEMIDYKSKDGVFGDEDMKQFYANMDANREWLSHHELILNFSSIILYDVSRFSDNYWKQHDFEFFLLQSFKHNYAYNNSPSCFDLWRRCWSILYYFLIWQFILASP